jgi:hypothetical protein
MLVLVSTVAGANPAVPDRALVGPWPAAVGAAAPVTAGFSIARTDGNDVRGALDLRSMRIERGRVKDTLTFSTHDAVSTTAIDPDNGNFAVLIDRNDDRTYEYGQYVFFAAGRVRGVLVNLRSDRVIDRTVPTSRTGPAGFRTVIQRGKIDSPGTYRFGLFAYNEDSPCTRRNPCVDTIPNRFPLIALDHRAPTAAIDAVDAYASDITATTTIPFGFSVADDRFGTGVKRWVVQTRELGSGTDWEEVDRGRTSSPTVDVTGEAGGTYDIRIVMTDRQRNRKISSMRRTSFPLDDRDGSIVYAGTTTQGSPGSAFLGTTTSLASGATATLDLDVSVDWEVCVVGGPAAAAASADWTLDGSSMPALAQDTTTPPRHRYPCIGLVAGTHTVVITGTSVEPFVLDAIYVKPA